MAWKIRCETCKWWTALKANGNVRGFCVELDQPTPCGFGCVHHPEFPRLLETVKKLPTTNDGWPLVHGDKVWYWRKPEYGYSIMLLSAIYSIAGHYEEYEGYDGMPTLVSEDFHERACKGCFSLDDYRPIYHSEDAAKAAQPPKENQQ
jgi:hypothetical protein